MKNIGVFWIPLCLILCFTSIIYGTNINNGIIFHYNNTYKYNVLYQLYVSKNTEYIMEFGGDKEYDTPARVSVASDFANGSYPLFITARQQKGVFSWQLPMIVQTANAIEEFTNISRTLCPHNNPFDEHEESCDISNQNTPIIHLTSSSPEEILVTVSVETVKDFFIKLNTTTNVTVTPSQPNYYFYPFKQDASNLVDLETARAQRKQICNRDLSDIEQGTLEKYMLRRNMLERDSKSWFWKPKSVILMIESEDDVCAVVSIQNFSCPVFDNERDILYDGYYLTMTRRGGITLTQDMFPLGFYIVFIVKSSDEDCIASSNELNSTVSRKVEYYEWLDNGPISSRFKRLSFKIVETISYQEYLIAAGAAFAVFFAFYIAFFVVVIWRRRSCIRNVEVTAVSVTGVNVTAVSVNNDERGDEWRNVSPLTPSINDNSGTRRRNINMAASVESTSTQVTRNEEESSDSDSEGSTLEDVNRDAEILIMPTKLCVATLARKKPKVLIARSKMYLWNVLTVAVFYTLPVIQLVVTYQRLLNQSGNQDLCYFNFFCAHPLFVLSDFNHVYSNLGYVMLGFLFLLEVWRRHRMHRMKTKEEKELGIPQHFGLLYAMGIALVSEGLLSAAYHVCPNSMNFQFDTSFMYVTGVLCMVKIYQSRHADVTAKAHATFGVLAFIIFIGLVGVLNANLSFWVAFTVLHLTTCLFMTFKIYYMGKFKFDGRAICNGARELATRPLYAITPTYCGRCVMLVIANLCNWTLAAYGVAQHSKDFASHLLLVLMSNLFIYTFFYIVMKLLHKESIRWYSWVFIVLTYSTWFLSSYFYLDQSTNWALTPAESRRSNRVCSLLDLYDSHDIWHFLSSIAMFFSFNMYLTIDDNLSRTPRSDIQVF